MTYDQKSRTIIVGYDRSPEARQALTTAAERAGPRGTLIVVHAAASPSELLDGFGYDDAVRAYRRRELEVREEIEDAALDGVTVLVEMEHMPAAQALVRAARHHDADEIVVGSRTMGPIRTALSSVSNAVVRLSDLPVLVVPQAQR